MFQNPFECVVVDANEEGEIRSKRAENLGENVPTPPGTADSVGPTQPSRTCLLQCAWIVDELTVVEH